MLKHQFALASNNIENEKITLWTNSPCITKIINIDDQFIQKVSNKLNNIKTIWVTSNENRQINNNLNYYGITIIPNEELKKLLDIIKETKNNKILKDVTNLLNSKKDNEIVIHFGI